MGESTAPGVEQDTGELERRCAMIDAPSDQSQSRVRNTIFTGQVLSYKLTPGFGGDIVRLEQPLVEMVQEYHKEVRLLQKNRHSLHWPAALPTTVYKLN